MTAPGRDMGIDSSAATVTGFMAASELRPGEVIGGRYRIERLLGMGGMGLVYRAHDLELDVDVALKLLRPELATRGDAFERFRQELLLARQVSSPHVVRIHDLVRHGGSWLISMDFVDGESLEHRLDRDGALPPDEAIRITRQLAEGLTAAHKRGVVHRDLKPANVMLSSQGEALVTDFGVARSAGSTGITGSGVIIGTPEYLSPEQARAETLDGRSDLYALGLIFYEMLTGTLPFRGGTPAEMLAQRIVRSPPDANLVRPGLPPFAVRLCARLLALRPAHRFQRAEDVVRAIDDRRLPRAPLDRRRLAGIAAAIAVTIAGTLAWLNWPIAPASVSAPTHAVLDLAPMPVLATDAADAQLATSITRWMARALTVSHGAQAADDERVARALTALRFTAESARRFRPQVAESLHARLLLEADLRRESDRLLLQLAAWAPGASQPAWIESSAAVELQALPAALDSLLQRVAARIGTRKVPRTPSTAALTLLADDSVPATDGAAVQQRIAAAAASLSADAWWQLLVVLERAGRRADAATAARAALDAVSTQSDDSSRRTSALAQVLLGDPDAALKISTALIAEHPQDLQLRRLHARALGESGNIDAARAALQEIVAIDERDGDSWFLLGKFAIMQGDARTAVDEYLVRAQILANRLGSASLLADTTNALGIGYAKLGQPQPAAEHYERAAKLRGALGDQRGEALSLRNLATVRSLQGDAVAAFDALAQARRILAPIGDPSAMADILNAVGLLEEERGEFQRALDAYREGLALRQAERNPRLIGESLLNVAFAYFQVGDFANAEVYWKQADDAYSGIDDRAGVVRSQQGLGLAKTARGDWIDGRAAFDGSLREAEAGQMAAEIAAGRIGLAELDRLEGRFAEALDNARQAYDLFKAQEDERGAIETVLLRAQTLIDLGDLTAAGTMLQALAANPPSNRDQVAMLEIQQAELALGAGDAGAALKASNAAIASARQAHSDGNALAAMLVQARALAASGRRRDALQTIRGVRDGLSRYTSVPLRLALAETGLLLDPQAALPDYRAARGTLAHLPSWGRALRLHAAAATVDNDALRAARAALAVARGKTPPEHLPALDALAAKLGIPVSSTP